MDGKITTGAADVLLRGGTRVAPPIERAAAQAADTAGRMVGDGVQVAADTAAAALKALQDKIAELTGQVADRDTKIGDLTRQLTTAVNAQADMATAAARQGGMVTSLTNQVGDLTSRNGDLTRQINTLTDSLNRAQTLIGQVGQETQRTANAMNDINRDWADGLSSGKYTTAQSYDPPQVQIQSRDDQIDMLKSKEQWGDYIVNKMKALLGL